MSDEDSGHISILVREGAPQSYVRRGQQTHLNPSQERIKPERTGLDPMSDEDSGHTYTSILVERVHLNPMSGEDSKRTSILVRRR